MTTVDKTDSGEPAWTSVGCYRDDARRNLKFGPKKYGYNQNTCRDACAKYRYFALQNNGWCCCGNEYGQQKQYPRVKTSECDKPYGKGMGGPWANAVYENNMFGQGKLNFCVDATAGNHIFEVYGSSSMDSSSRWTFQVNGGKWQEFTQVNLNKYKKLE
jgi:hypothetical protein